MRDLVWNERLQFLQLACHERARLFVRFVDTDNHRLVLQCGMFVLSRQV